MLLLGHAHCSTMRTRSTMSGEYNGIDIMLSRIVDLSLLRNHARYQSLNKSTGALTIKSSVGEVVCLHISKISSHN